MEVLAHPVRVLTIASCAKTSAACHATFLMQVLTPQPFINIDASADIYGHVNAAFWFIMQPFYQVRTSTLSPQCHFPLTTRSICQSFTLGLSYKDYRTVEGAAEKMT